MLRGSDGLCGGGIYFAGSASETEAKAHQKGVVLKAEVNLGRTKHVHGSCPDATHSRLKAEGYDSVTLHGRASGTEYVVYNHSQVRNIRRFS